MKLLDKDGLTYYTGKIKNELTDYVKNTDYATSSVAGVIIANSNYGVKVNINNGLMSCPAVSYANYSNANVEMFIGKGTLENVLTEKIGTIDTILETLTVGTGV